MDETRLQQVLNSRPCGLLTDIDGTLSPVVPSPDLAQVSPSVRQQLEVLAQRIELVAAISGRAATDAARLVGVPNLTYVGNHGLEIWRDGKTELIPAAQSYIGAINDLMRQAQARIKLPGVVFEDKRATASIHYRQTADPAQAEEQIHETLQELAAQQGLILTQGRMVWEIRPPLEINKGVAARQLVQEHGLHGVIFLGDDRTDVDAFAVLRGLRECGECATLNVGVAGPETPAAVREMADILVDGVPGIERLLAQLAAYIK